MRVAELINKKKHNNRLSCEDLAFFINGYVSGEIPDYQASALLMAIWFNGMDAGETYELTVAMAASGDQIDLSAIPGTKVDKHSTGGVADTTTLITAPLVAACGGKVAKMSGRGLGHTGGTLDKLESIPGFQVSIGMDEFAAIVTTCGLSVIGQTGTLVPADKKLYALRDVTGTIDNLSLIASSIMSKKLAAGADAIVLDVKTGSGAFMRESKDAEALARAMVDIGNRSGRRTVAVVTDMNQPLGRAVGNSMEVKEAIEVLRGDRPGDLLDVSIELAARMVGMVYPEIGEEEAREKVGAALSSGAGLERLSCMIESQHGNPRVVDDPGLLSKASRTVGLKAKTSGFVVGMNAEDIGTAALLLGAGRMKKSDTVDPAVGIWMEKRLGDSVGAGDVLGVFHVNDASRLEEAMRLFESAVTITPGKSHAPPLIHRYIT
jgi:pyrimidine-nucleoside phosphorylase